MEIALARIEVHTVANAMIRKSSLPNWHVGSYAMRESAFDQLHRPFQRALLRCDDQMDVVRHDDKAKELVVTEPAVSLQGLDEEAGVGGDLEEPAAIVGGARYEICSRLCATCGNCPVIQRTSGAKAPNLCPAHTARLKPCP